MLQRYALPNFNSLRLYIKICFNLTLIACILNTGCNVLPASDSSRKLSDLKNNPKENFDSSISKNDNTQVEYEKILATHSKSLDILYYEESLKRAAQLALVDYEEALLNSEYNTVNTKSIKMFESWLASNAMHNDAAAVTYLLAKNYSLDGEIEKSEVVLRRLINNYPNAPMVGESHFRLAESAYIRREYDQAAFYYQKAIKLDNSSAITRWSFYMLGWTEYKRGLIDQSITAFAKYVELQLQDQTVHELSKSDQETVNDVIRALALQIANSSRSDILINYYQSNSSKHAYHVFASISDYLESVDRWYEGITVLRSYFIAFPEEKNAILARREVIDLFEKNGQIQVANKEKKDFIDVFSNISQAPQVNKSLIEIIRSQYLLDLAGFNETIISKEVNNFSDSIYYYKIFVNDYPKHQHYHSALYNLSLLYFKLNKFDDALSGFEFLREKKNFIKQEDCAILSIQARRSKYEAMKNASNDSETILVNFRNKLLNDYSFYIYHFATGNNIQEVINAATMLAINHHEQDYLLNLIQKIDTLKLSSESKIAIHEQAADYFYKQSIWSRSIELYENLIERYSSFKGVNRWISQAANAHFELAMELKNNKQWDNSLKHLTIISQKYPSFILSSTVLYQTALIYRETLMYAQSNHYLHKIKDQSVPGVSKADLYLLLADNAVKVGDNDASANLYKQYSTQVDSQENKIAALQKSAELYKSSNNQQETIGVLEELLVLKKSDMQESITLHNELINFYIKQKQINKINFHSKFIVDLSLSLQQPTTIEINTIRAKYVLKKAKNNFEKFNALKITAPIEQSFNAKYLIITNTIDLLDHVKALNVSRYQYESEFLLGDLFYRFAQDLLHSEVPPNLTEDEALEYQALLEEQAYPFEEKAIELFKLNFSQLKNRDEDKWIILNRQRLETLLPALFLKSEKILPKYVD
ncbi:MAG: tetratricopeptide repeat protein [Pseudomonadota bacterium]